MSAHPLTDVLGRPLIPPWLLVLPNGIGMVQTVSCLRLPSSFRIMFPWERWNHSWRIMRGQALYVPKYVGYELKWPAFYVHQRTSNWFFETPKGSSSRILYQSASGPRAKRLLCLIERISALVSVGLLSSPGLLFLGSHIPGALLLAQKCFPCCTLDYSFTTFMTALAVI